MKREMTTLTEKEGRAPEPLTCARPLRPASPHTGLLLVQANALRLLLRPTRLWMPRSLTGNVLRLERKSGNRGDSRKTSGKNCWGPAGTSPGELRTGRGNNSELRKSGMDVSRRARRKRDRKS